MWTQLITLARSSNYNLKSDLTLCRVFCYSILQASPPDVVIVLSLFTGSQAKNGPQKLHTMQSPYSVMHMLARYATTALCWPGLDALRAEAVQLNYWTYVPNFISDHYT